MRLLTLLLLATTHNTRAFQLSPHTFNKGNSRHNAIFCLPPPPTSPPSYFHSNSCLSSSTSSSSSTIEPNPAVVSELMKMSNNMLKELLSDRKLKTAGSKQLLADRLAVQMEKEVKTESLRKELVSSTSAAEAYSSSPPSSSQFPSSSSFKQSPFHTALSSSNPNLPPLTQRTTSYLNKLSVTSPTKIQSAVLPRFLDPQTKEVRLNKDLHHTKPHHITNITLSNPGILHPDNYPRRDRLWQNLSLPPANR